MKKKLFMLLALVMTAMTASAYDLTVGTSEHGTITFKIDGTTATSANENDVVTVEITPATGYVVNQPSGQWIAAVAAARSNAPIDLLKDVELTAAGTNTWTFTMKRANVEISATYKKLLTNTDITVQDIDALTYNGEAQEPTVTVKDGTTTLVLNTDYTVSYENNVNVGTATATVTALANSTKYSGSASKTFSITKKALTVKAEDKSVTFGDDAPTYTETYDGFVNNETKAVLSGTLAFACDYVKNQTGAGNYDITPSGLTSSNYDITFTKGTLTVGKKALESSMIANIASLVYNGVAQEPAPVVTFNGMTLEKDVDYTVSYENNVNVGTATATVTALANSTKYSGSASKTFSITKKALTVTADNKSVTFGDDAPTYTETYDGFVNNETETVLGGTLALSCDYVQNQSGVGTYAITPSGLTSSNYDITFTAGTLTVSAKALEDAFIADIAAVTYNGQAQTPAPVLTFNGMTLVAGTDYTVAYQDNVNVGTATVTATAVAGGNYSGTAQKTFAIQKKALTVTADNKTATYGDEAPEYTVSYDGFVNNETETVLGGTLALACDYVKDQSGVGTYAITPSGLTSSNYDITFTAGTLTVSAKALEDAFIADIAAVTYNGQAQTPAPVLTFNGMTLVAGTDYTVAYQDNVNVGTATVTATAVAGGNYSGTASKTFAIQKKALTVTADNKTATYGDAAPEYTVSYDGFVNNETETVLGGTLALACDYVKDQSGVGTYAITPSGLTSSNYDITFTAGTLTVSAKALEDAFIADIAAVTYNGQAQTPAPVLTFNGMTLVAGTDYTVAYQDNVNVGTATVTATAVAGGNYSGTASKTFVINPAGANLFDLTLDPTEYIYDGTAKTPAVTVKDGETVLVENTDYELAFTNNVNAGTATVTATGKGNYSGTASTTFAINKAALTVTADDKTVTYGDVAPEYTVSYDGFVNNETETVLGGTLALACDYVQNQSGVGTYAITPSGLTSSNYDITFTAGTLTVSAKALEDAFIADIDALTYNGQAQTPAPVLTFNGMTLVAGTDYTVAYQDNVNVGTATVTATAVAGGNYSGTASTTFVINPAGANLFDLTLDPTEYIYDGTAKTPAVTVKDGETVLVEDTDYELAFTNNVNAGTATVTATGKGNYSGTASTTFAINKAALTVTADDKTVTYGDVAPEYTVSYDGFVNNETETVLGGTLALACDYVQNQSGVGTYAITPSGLTSSNYDITFTAGTLTVSAKALEDAFIADIAAVTYNGQAQTPAPVLTFNGMTLAESTDYTLAYENNVNAGTATVTATGTGNYSGTASKTFTINPAALTAATLQETNFTYNQQEQTAEVASVKAGTLTVPAEGYDVSGNKATTVGTYTATITGKGNYTGEVKAQFSIVAADANLFELTLDPTEFTYNSQEQKPTVTVKDGDATLVAGTDYTVSYQNNVNVGTATVTVTGQGNYEGTKTAQFTIVRDMSTVFSEGSSWATYVAQEDLELPEGIEAYAVTGATATEVSAEAISYIPAGVGILLNRSDVTKTDFKGYAYEGVTATIESLLVGSATEATNMTTYKDFVLYRDEFVLSGAASVAAGHAYLPAANATAGAARRSIVIGGEATGISEELRVKSEEFATAAWYDLNGRKLQATPTKKGIYIRNGKKVVVK